MNDLELQQLLAQQAQYQGQRQSAMPQGRMVGRTYVAPNALEHIAAGLRQYGGIKGEQQVTGEINQLRTKREGMDADAMAKFIAPLRGEEARDIQPLTPMDDDGNAMPVARKEAVAPGTLNYGALQGAYSPQLRQMGMQGLITTQQEAAKKAQADALTAKYGQILSSGIKPQQAIAMGVPAEFVKSYMEAPNLGRPKVQFKDQGGQLTPVTEYGDTPEGIKPMPKTGNPFSDMLIRDASGNIVPNAPLVGAKTQVASAGKPVVNVTNKIENKAAENIAGQVGGLLKESSVAAEGAVRTMDAANRIVQAVDSGGVIAGPMANARITARQAAQLLGVGGASNAEVLANTRSAIRGLAEMTLQGRKQMSGQGAITESESKLAEKAMSGDISDLTPAEIRQLALASARAAQWTIQTHQKRMEAAENLPGTKGLTPFFSTPAMPGMPNGFRVLP